MKKTQKYFIGVLTIVFLIVLSVNSFAAKGSFSLSKTSVSLSEGGKTTISIKATNCEGRFSVSSSNTNVVKVNTSSTWITGSSSITLTAVKAGTAKITIVAEDVADTSENVVSGTKTISVTVKAKSSNTTNGSGTNSSSKKPTFTSTNKKVYAKGDINLRASWSTSSSATPVSKGTEMTLTGASSKSVNGYVWYRVSYKGSTKYVASSLVTTTKPSESSDKKDDQKDDNKDDDKKDDENKANSINLKSLSVTPTGISPVFASGTTEYTMTVGADTDEIDIKAIAEDKNASVKVTGNTDLKIGNNKITITVTGANKKTKVYHITVTKEEKKHLQLSELLIEGLPLEPEFDSNIYEYHLTLDKSDVSELNITATPSKKNAKVEIVGNTDLKPGENVITVLVKSSDEEDITTYQIAVTIPSENVTDAEKENNNKDIYMYVGIGAGIIIVLIFMIIIIKKCTNKKENTIYYGMYHTNEDDDQNEDKNKSMNESVLKNTNVDLDKLPKFVNEDLPKSLRKETFDINDNLNTVKFDDNTNYMDIMHTEEKNDEDSITRIDRSKKIDEFYNIDDEMKPKRRGKHSK